MPAKTTSKGQAKGGLCGHLAFRFIIFFNYYFCGLEATRQIRRSAEVGGIPIIFVSGCAEAGYRRAALDAGGNEYLIKPIIFEHLETVVAKYIGDPGAAGNQFSSDGS